MTLGKLIRIGAAALGALTVSMNADAADMNGYGGYRGGPGYAGVNWSGLYVGANGGYGWANNNQETDQGLTPPPFGGLSPSGGFGGGQIGYSWQGLIHPSLVLGVEADIQGSDINDSGMDGIGDHFKSSLDYFGTVRGRIGYAADRALIYFTGGFAYGGLRKASDDWANVGYQTNSGNATGYVLGGGVEYKFSPVWSVKAEYQYINLGQNDLCGGGNTLCFSDPTQAGSQKDDDYHTVRVGVNYWVAPAYMPLK